MQQPPYDPETGGIDDPATPASLGGVPRIGGSALQTATDESDALADARRAPRGFTAVAWVLILAVSLALMVLAHAAPEDATGETPGDTMGTVVMELQGKTIIGGAATSPETRKALLPQAELALNIGPVEQRMRFIVMAAELGGTSVASQKLAELEALIEIERSARIIDVDDDTSGDGTESDTEETDSDEPFELTPQQEHLLSILHTLYDNSEVASLDDPASARVPNVAALSNADRELLRQSLGWFGRLALHPEGSDDPAERDAVIAPAKAIMAGMMGGVIVAVAVGFIGFVGLIILVVLAFLGRVRSGVKPGQWHHGLYAETFAIWLLLFLLMQLGAGVIAAMMPALGLMPVLVGFFGSLIALLWPRLRGIPWSDIRQDVGWSLGRIPIVEPLIGVAGYAMALPIVAVGVLITYLLLQLSLMFAAEGGTFDSYSGPAHPIILELAGPDLWPKIQVLLLAAVAAPIVEETMFRGVLYRHLRDASRWTGAPISILVSGTLSGFVFASIHPQGWVAIPALMALAYGFTIVREWRGTLVPAMVVHGISNGLVMSLLILMLGTGSP